MNTLEVLIAARKLIEKPENWCKGAYARTARDYEVGPKEATATKWCVFGAVWKVADDPNGIAASNARWALNEQADGAVLLNDTTSTTHADVLAAFDRAIAAERGRAR